MPSPNVAGPGDNVELSVDNTATFCYLQKSGGKPPHFNATPWYVSNKMGCETLPKWYKGNRHVLEWTLGTMYTYECNYHVSYKRLSIYSHDHHEWSWLQGNHQRQGIQRRSSVTMSHPPTHGQSMWGDTTRCACFFCPLVPCEKLHVGRNNYTFYPNTLFTGCGVG